MPVGNALSFAAMSDPVPASAYSKANPFPARLTENRRLNQPGSAKETRHLVLNLAGSGLQYEAGDSLGVQPENRPSEVAELLTRLRASGDELVSPVMLRLPAPRPLRDVLASGLALAGPQLDLVVAGRCAVARDARRV